MISKEKNTKKRITTYYFDAQLVNLKKYHLILIGDDNVLIESVADDFRNLCVKTFMLDEALITIEINPNKITRYNDLNCCLYFGRKKDCKMDEELLALELIKYSIPVIPIAEKGDSIVVYPECVRKYNAILINGNYSSARLNILKTLCHYFGLIRAERRIFISYARRDSRKVALQLFDELSRRGYSVFLDTVSIEKGEEFQDELWHHMADSDLVVMLNTKRYTKSHWCQEEYIKALSHRIGLFSVSWPGVASSDDETWKLTGQYILDECCFASNKYLRKPVMQRLLNEIENVRISNIASRKTLLIREFICAEENRNIKAYYDVIDNIIHSSSKEDYLPVLGVPKSEQFNEIRKRRKSINLLYYPDMIRRDWLDYLDWINSFNLPIKTHGFWMNKEEKGHD